MLFAIQPLPDFLRKFSGDDLLLSRFLELLPHVDDLNFREWPLLYSVRKLKQCVFVFLRVEI